MRVIRLGNINGGSTTNGRDGEHNQKYDTKIE